MGEYDWPGWGNYRDRAALAERAWPETVHSLPVGAPITAEVIGRQPFGVFLRIEGHADAIGLAEVTAMPRGCRCLTLPSVGERITGVVRWLNDHNFQVKVELDAWAQHPNAFTELADMVGQIVVGTVVALGSLGAIVRVGVCAVGLIPRADLAPKHSADTGRLLQNFQQVPVRIVNVDADRRKMLLAPA